jgi:hypothetical protein
MIAKQAANDEITVPPIHLVELAPRHNVRILEIQKAAGADLARVNFTGSVDSHGKMFHAYPAVILQFGY